MKLSHKRFSYAWVIVATCFFLELIVSGFATGYRGLYLAAVTEGLQIPRSLFSISDSCRFVAGAVMSIFFGRLFQHFGARRLVIIGFITLISSMLVYANVDKVIWFCVAGTLLGIGGVFTVGTITAALVRQWCDKNVGTIMGIVTAASGIGSAIGSQIISPILYDPENPLGFRDAYKLTAVILFVTALIIIPLLREKRDSSTDNRQNTSAKTSENQAPENKALLLVVIALVFLCAVSIMGVNGIYSAHMKDRGLTPATVATAASMLSVTLIVSKISVGRIFDRFGLRPLLLLCQFATLTAFILLLNLNAATDLSVIFAIIFAFALPLETIVVPLIVSELFPSTSYNHVLGILAAANSTGFAVAPPLSNLFFDGFGSYDFVIWCCAGIMLILILAFQWIITVTHRKNRTSLNQVS